MGTIQQMKWAEKQSSENHCIIYRTWDRPQTIEEPQTLELNQTAKLKACFPLRLLRKIQQVKKAG